MRHILKSSVLAVSLLGVSLPVLGQSAGTETSTQPATQPQIKQHNVQPIQTTKKVEELALKNDLSQAKKLQQQAKSARVHGFLSLLKGKRLSKEAVNDTKLSDKDARSAIQEKAKISSLTTTINQHQESLKSLVNEAIK